MVRSPVWPFIFSHRVGIQKLVDEVQPWNPADNLLIAHTKDGMRSLSTVSLLFSILQWSLVSNSLLQCFRNQTLPDNTYTSPALLERVDILHVHSLHPHSHPVCSPFDSIRFYSSFPIPPSPPPLFHSTSPFLVLLVTRANTMILITLLLVRSIAREGRSRSLL